MTTQDVLKLLGQMDRRLATIRDAALETRRQAQHTLDCLDRLRQDLERLRWGAAGETSDCLPSTPSETG